METHSANLFKGLNRLDTVSSQNRQKKLVRYGQSLFLFAVGKEGLWARTTIKSYSVV